MFTSQEILLGLRQADPQMIQYLLQHLQPDIRRLLMEKGATKEEAEDLFMISLEAIYYKLKADKNFDLNSASLTTYLSRIALFQWYKIFRRKKWHSNVTIESLEVPDQEDIVEIAHHASRVQLMREKLNLLSAACRQLLAYHQVEKLSMAQIATRMNYTEGFARKKKHSCKEKLISMVQADPRYTELKS
jgi:RNA polymerase sigma factor (sigma-70 family)